MRSLLLLSLAIAPAFSQSPVARIINTSHPGKEFQIGDRFEVAVFGSPDQPVSVRTVIANRTDWSPVIGRTDSSGFMHDSGGRVTAMSIGEDRVWDVRLARIH